MARKGWLPLRQRCQSPGLCVAPVIDGDEPDEHLQQFLKPSWNEIDISWILLKIFYVCQNDRFMIKFRLKSVIIFC